MTTKKTVANRHESWELKQLQSLPFKEKVRLAERRITQCYERYDGDVYVAFSGGKDSRVLSHMVKNLYPDVPLVYVKNGLEHRSVTAFAEKYADVVRRPRRDFLSIIRTFGYPVISKEVAQAVYDVQRARADGAEPPAYHMEKFRGEKLDRNGEKSMYNMDKYAFLLDAPFRVSHMCCVESKEAAALEYERETGRVPIIGTLASESQLRRSSWIRFGCNAFDDGRRPRSRPLSVWTEQDILRYIQTYKLELAPEYGKVAADLPVYVQGQENIFDLTGMYDDIPLKLTGAKRTGCIFCLFGITKDTDRLVRLKLSDPALYDYVMRGGKFDESGMWIPDGGLGYKFVVDWLNQNGNLGIRY